MDSIISASLPDNNSITSLSISEMREATGASTTETSRRSVALIAVVISTDSVTDVGDVALFLLLLLRYFLPSAHMWILICPVSFSLSNISAWSALTRCSVVINFLFLGLKDSLS